MKSLNVGMTLAAVLFTSSAFAGGHARNEVTITNITKGQTFTPQQVVSHGASIRLVELGAPASEKLAILAEAGNTNPITDALMEAGWALIDVSTIPGPLEPRHSVSTEISTKCSARWTTTGATR